MRTTYGELDGLVGTTLGPGDWVDVTQERIDRFAEATEDPQWIHVDAERAAAGPFGGTVAHGYLTLSLLPRLMRGLLVVDGVAMVVNAGSDRVRFVAPVRSGKRVRATAVVAAVTPGKRGTRVESDVTVEIEGEPKPALVARTLALHVPAAPS
ncbi:MaoC family dehydratase [Myceligenerans pegani]|uniref:MaoC family dehydratase n=1 Tax=Myceligenerans pegani TaxID=2776917 RepID=A0ABR9MW62_9MICO|nr:MaoC family dehydratase [Myceligenerans sp. TRM 65318]MBE1875627.1 MaoC family dehydratase [Myceligenerans sp. TRM 65318]MBE3017898.1 MaoC family dehydratase [Myceligenerans sp. TRM 65318]